MRHNLPQRLQNKAPRAKGGVGNGEMRAGISPARPEDNIKIKRAGAPALALALTAKACLNLLEVCKQSIRCQHGFYQDGAVAIGATGRANRKARVWRGKCDTAQRPSVEGLYGLRKNRPWRAEAVVALVAAQRNGVKRQILARVNKGLPADKPLSLLNVQQQALEQPKRAVVAAALDAS